MPAITRRFIDTSEGQLHCRVAGRGEPVVLLQTMPFGTLPLLPLVERLGSDCACHSIDLMGCAPSDDRRRPWSVEDHAANLLEAFDLLGLERIRLLGGHFTALVAVEMALRQPQRFSHLVLDGLYAWTVEEQAPYRSGSRPPPPWSTDGAHMQARWEGFIAILKRFDPQFEVTPDNATQVAKLGFGMMQMGVGGPPQPTATFDYDLLPRLPRLAVPTLLVRSPTDSLRNFHERAMGLVPQAREHVFEQVNPLQQARDTARIAEYEAMLRGFLGLRG